MAMPATTMAGAPPQALLPQAPIEVSAAPKRFDLMTVDSGRHRLLAAHSQAGTLTAVDLAAGKLEREVPVGKSSGVAVDPQDGKYFVGTTRGGRRRRSRHARQDRLHSDPGSGRRHGL